ncbi:hypothetical protein PYW08_002979 [Mythimna loreyi]|uniref:Uncharacterized protein n=1 Tax=Mythimna loreyi TaxID=667449 RepID=A0ACC2QPT5_9NEOP|nr:hypothetical protein PYW08_002979 [Mythimna loreyi]
MFVVGDIYYKYLFGKYCIATVLFGSFAGLSGLLIFTTPETLGTTLSDTFEDAEQRKDKTYVISIAYIYSL